MGRAPSRDQNGLKKGPWAEEEDEKLVDYIQKHGCGNWRTLPSNAGLQRCGKSCRLRWTNYLRPDIKRGKFSIEEEDTIIHLHSFLGNKWSLIAARLPGRTDNEIKNSWNTHIRKRLLRMGIDPVTHSAPILNSPSSSINVCSAGFNHDLLRFATSGQVSYLPLHQNQIIMSSDNDQILPPPPMIQTSPPDPDQELAMQYCNSSRFRTNSANENGRDQQLAQVQNLGGFHCDSGYEDYMSLPSGDSGYYSVMDPATSSLQYSSILKSVDSTNMV